MSWLSDPSAWSALVALLVLEIVLGVDNVIFISILAAKLPADQQGQARQIGLLAAGGMRLLLLFSVGWIISLKDELLGFTLLVAISVFLAKNSSCWLVVCFSFTKQQKKFTTNSKVKTMPMVRAVLTFGAVIAGHVARCGVFA